MTAALHADDRGVAAWRRLRPGFDLDRADGEQVRLLPLVLRTLTSTGSADPDLGRMIGLRRLGWMRSMFVIQAGSLAVAALRAAGIEVMALKGVALASSVYEHASLRPMVDADLLVRPADVPASLHVLGELGYALRPPVNRRHALLRHGVHLESDRGGHVDLHWMAHRALAPPGISRTFPALPWESDLPIDEWWGRARTVDLQGVEVRVPSPTDLLLHVCLHGALGGAGTRLRWVPDASAVVDRGGVDWSLLVAQGRRRRVSATLGSGLRYLREGQHLAVPVEVVHELLAARRGPRVRLAEHVSTRPLPGRSPAFGYLPNTAVRYLLLTRQDPATDAARGVPGFLAATWDVAPGTRALAAAAVSRARALVGATRPPAQP